MASWYRKIGRRAGRVARAGATPPAGEEVLRVERVRTRGQLREFVQFNHDLYRGHPYHIPDLLEDELATLSREQNPAYEFCDVELFLVYRGGAVVGRVAGIINHRANSKWGENRARFGWIDFIDDDAVVDLLLGAVEAWARERGCEALHGPVGFTDLDKEGMLVEGFEQLGTMITTYNYPYYPVQMERCGYAKEIDWLEFKIYVPKRVPEKHHRMSQIVQERYGLRLVKARKRSELMKYGRAIFHLINEAYESLYGVTTLTEAQIDYYIKIYLPLVNLDFVNLVVREEDDLLVGFAITLPSMSRALQRSGGRMWPTGFVHLLRALRSKSSEIVDLLLIGVKPEYQNKGVNALIFEDLIQVMNRYQVKYAESNPELETNVSVMLQWNNFKKVHHKRRRAYVKRLVEEPRRESEL